MKHLGDYDAGGTLHSKFTTYRPSTGAPFTLAGTPALSVYKDGSVTQSTAGITLTADFDGVAGLHHVAVDTSADGTFYSAGSHFEIVITTGTVDGVSVVGSCVASFSLRKDSALKPTVAARTLDVSATGEAGLDWANIGSPTTAVNLSATNIDVDQVVASVTGAVGSVTGAVGSVTGNVGGNVNGSVASVGAGGITASSIAADAIGASELAADAVTEIAGAVWAVATRELTSGANIALAKGVGVTGFNDLDAAGVRGAVGLASANLDTQIAAVQSDTNDIQTRLPAALVSGRIDASVGAMAANTLTASALASDAVTEIQTGLSTLDAAGIRTAVGLASANLDTQLGAINSKTTNLPTDPADESLIIAATDAIMTRLGAPAGASVSADIAAVKADSAAILIDTAEIGAAGAGLTALASAANLATVAGYLDTEIAAILADTNELQTDWANGGRLDLILDARASQASVDTIDGIVDSILVDTAEIGAAGAGLTALASAANLATLTGYVDTEVAAIKATTDKLDGTLTLSSDGYIFTPAALQDAPTGGSAPSAATIAAAVWEEPIASHSGTSGSTAEALAAAGASGDPWITALPGAYSAGQAGYIVGNALDATISSRASQTSVNAIDDFVDTEVAAIKAVTDKLDTTLELTSDGQIFTAAALQNAPVTPAGLDAAGVRAAVGLASANLDTQLADLPTNAELATALGSSDDALLAVLGTPAGASLAADVASVQADTNDLQSRIPAALISGRIDATVGAMQSNVMTAAAAAADLTTELQSGLATSSALSTIDGKIDTIDTNVDAILVDTTEIGVAGAGLTALASAANLATVAGYLDTEIAAIKAKTDALPASPAATGDIPSAATIADAVHDEVIEGTTTLRQSIRLHNSALGGKVVGLDTFNPVFRDLADTKDVIDATVDSYGNRSAVTRDLS